MVCRRFFTAVAFLEMLWGAWCVLPCAAQTGESPAMNDLPQRMPAYGVPTPPTAPSTASSSYYTPSASSTSSPNYASSNYAASSSLATPNGVPSPYDVPLPGVTATAAPPGTGLTTTQPAQTLPSIYDNVDTAWSWQVLPDGLMYRSYQAGRLEPRLGSELLYQRGYGWYWDAQVGARVGLLRYGDTDPLTPQGWQFDVEGAAFPRLDLQSNEDLDCADFRGGFLFTNRTGIIETKFGFYHLSSHLGDEYMLSHPDDFRRINYVRESLVAGISIHPLRWLRLYGEAGWCFQEDGGASPWELQFGVEASSPEPTGRRGTPFVAANAHLRQENNFGGNVNVQLGWLWRGPTGRTFRVGAEYFNGMSEEYQYYDHFEDQVGVGLWYDF